MHFGYQALGQQKLMVKTTLDLVMHHGVCHKMVKLEKLVLTVLDSLYGMKLVKVPWESIVLSQSIKLYYFTSFFFIIFK